jgi:hypothetical protein
VITIVHYTQRVENKSTCFLIRNLCEKPHKLNPEFSLFLGVEYLMI